MPLSGALCIGGVPLTGVPGSADTWPNGVVGVSGSWSSSDSSAPLPKSVSCGGGGGGGLAARPGGGPKGPQAGQQSAPHMHVLVCICSNVRQFH